MEAHVLYLKTDHLSILKIGNESATFALVARRPAFENNGLLLTRLATYRTNHSTSSFGTEILNIFWLSSHFKIWFQFGWTLADSRLWSSRKRRDGLSRRSPENDREWLLLNVKNEKTSHADQMWRRNGARPSLRRAPSQVLIRRSEWNSLHVIKT